MREEDIYYLCEGAVEVLIPATGNTENIAVTLLESSFFGEMGHFLLEERTASVIAKTDVSVMALSPRFFEEIQKNDPTLDRAIIEQLSQRLKDNNDKLNSLATVKQH